MSDIASDCWLAAFGAMSVGGPKTLIVRAQTEADDRGWKHDIGVSALCAYLASASLNDVLRKAIHLAVSRWDIAPSEDEWTAGTAARSGERRTRTYEMLGFSKLAGAIQCFDDLFPLDHLRAVVISEEFQPWYSSILRETRGALYYSSYENVLRRKNWPVSALASLDESTTQVVERLTDPQRVEARQAKGLVVGYVQSGKTANFTGVIAKSIDAGYRLVIVLTGTIDVLRRQTQRRIDMELVGKENILGGIDPDDADLMAHVDYQDDADWESKFLSFGFSPSSRNYPDIMRLTGARLDYKALSAGIAALEFEKRRPDLPLFDAENLPLSKARIVVVKKNKAVLTKLVQDLRRIKTPAHEIPTLIIDDESDQASVNTSNPKKWSAGKTERTAINKLISRLLSLLPRAQYVGYTATPFANVFVDPSDTEDIFPKDFLISLARPPGYMGVADFHDLDTGVEPEQRNISNSNEKAFVRNAVGTAGAPKLQECLDAFVLSGALKLYRQQAGQATYRHHTMLLHESVEQLAHGALATEVRSIWSNSGFSGATGLARLKTLYVDDFQLVSKAHGGDFTFPHDFDALKPHIAQALAKITALKNDPVIVVNGDKEMSSEEIDFDKREVWRILIGGAKLSRGFTVEGLTISYYRRKTRQADTLMQMGRWFGFRPGYHDLVRLYIGRSEPDRPGKTVDLYEAFGAVVRDEEAFREQLRQYSQLVGGRPQITPKDIPPLVSQHLPWLKPSSANKMFNAELVVRRTSGSLVIPTGYPIDAKSKRTNYAAVQPLLASATENVELVIPEDGPAPRSKFAAWIGEVDSKTFLAAIDAIVWTTADYYRADKVFLHEVGDKIGHWVVIAPQTTEVENVRNLPKVGPRTVFKRDLKPPNYTLWGEPTDKKHRWPAKLLTGTTPDYGDPAIAARKRPNTGAVLIYPMSRDVTELAGNPDPEDIVLAVAWIMPSGLSIGGTVVQFRAKDSARANQPIVPVAS
jgi:Z1 domain